MNLHSYQAGLAEQVRRRTGMPVRAVGGIADPRQAQAIQYRLGAGLRA
ncbi:NADH:flavin oxidoreductase [Bordetella pertussis]|nr:NADH:flavin oxidoreductase [Bordetella pertussis]